MYHPFSVTENGKKRTIRILDSSISRHVIINTLTSGLRREGWVGIL